MYPFFYHHLDPVEEDGWKIYCIETDFKELLLCCPNWRISCANDRYEVIIKAVIQGRDGSRAILSLVYRTQRPNSMMPKLEVVPKQTPKLTELRQKYMEKRHFQLSKLQELQRQCICAIKYAVMYEF